MGFLGSNAAAGRIVLLPGTFWAHVLPKWPLWAHLFYSIFYSVSELRRAWPGACRTSHASARRIVSCGGLALPPCAPKSHMCPLPHFYIWGFPIFQIPGMSIRHSPRLSPVPEQQKISKCPKRPPSHIIRADFRKGMRTATFHFSQSGGSMNGPNLFTEMPFL